MAAAEKTGGRKKGGLFKKLLGTLVVLAMLLLIGVALLPVLAGGFVRGPAERAITDALGGTARVDRVGLSWLGGQTVGPITIENGRLASGEKIRSASVTIEVDQGLLGLMSLDLGTITVTGDATVIRPAPREASPAAESAAAAPAPATSGQSSLTLPAGLRATLVLDSLALRVEDAELGAIEIPDLDARVAVSTDAPIDVALTAALRRADSLAELQDAGTDAGILDITATLDGLINELGGLTPYNATVEANVQAEGISTAAIDALAKQADAYAGALGGTLDIDIEASGNLLAPVATVGVTSERLNADLRLRREGDAIIAEPTDGIRLDTTDLMALPTIASQLEAAGLSVRTAPSVVAQIEQLRIGLINGQTPDVNGIAATLAISTTDAGFELPGEKLGRAGGTAVLSLPPMAATISTDRLAEAVSLLAAAEVEIDGSPAGSLRADATARDLVHFDASNPNVVGTLRAAGIPSALLEPFLNNGTDLVEALGPTLELEAVLDTDRATLAVVGEHVEVNAPLARLGGLAFEAAEPIAVVLRRPRGLVDGYAAPAGVLIDEAGPIEISIEALTLDATDGLRASAAGALNAGALRARLAPATADADPTPIALGRTELTFDVGIADNTITTAGDGVRIAVADVAGLLPAGGLTGTGGPMPLDVTVSGLVFPIPSSADTTPALDRAAVDARIQLGTLALAGEGPLPVGVSLPGLEAAAIASPGQPVRLTIMSEEGALERGELVPAGADGSAPIVLDQARVSLGGDLAVPTSVLSSGDVPAIVDAITGEIGARLAGVRLLAGGTLPDRIAATRIDATTTFEPGQPITVGLDVPDARLIGVRLQNADGTQTALPNTKLVLSANAEVPAAGVLPGGTAPAEVVATFTMDTTTVDGEPVGSARGRATASLLGGAPAGPIAANITASELQLALLEPFAGGPGLLTGALGPTADAEVALRMTLPDDGALLGPMDASLALTSQTFRTSAPLRVTSDGSVVRLVESMVADWTVQPALVAALVPPPEGEAESAISLAQPATIRLTADALVLPIGTGASEALNVEVSLAGEDLPVRLPDGSTRSFTGLAAQARTTGETGQMLITGELGDGGRQILSMRTRVDNLTDVNNALTTDAATLTGGLDLTAAPSALIDALAQTGDLAAGFLGPALNAEVRYQRLSATGGALRIQANSDNVEAGLVGVIRDGRFVINRPAGIRVNTIDQAFGTRLASVIPVFGSLTKSATDDPAVVRAERLAIPLDGDIAKYVAELTIDAGTATYGLEVGLGNLLNPAEFARGNRLGDSFQPFTATMRNGKLAVRGLALPIGEFSIPAQGDYDLVNSTERVVVQLPTGMLAAEAIGDQAGPFGNILGNLLNVPVVKEGALGGDNQWKPDPGARIEGAPQNGNTNQGDPASRLLDGIGDLLRRGGDG